MRTPALARSLGVPFSTLNHWTHAGLIRPVVPAAGSGTQREYDETGERQARLARTLLAFGLRWSVVRSATALAPSGPFLIVDAAGPRYGSRCDAALAIADGAVVVRVA